MNTDESVDVAMIALNDEGVPNFIRATTSLLHFATVGIRLHVLVNDASQRVIQDSRWLKDMNSLGEEVIQVQLYHVSQYKGKVDTSLDGFRRGVTGSFLFSCSLNFFFFRFFN